MKFRKLDLSNYPILNNIVFDVYELTAENTPFIYSTIPNGIIGISIVLEGFHQILFENKWNLSPQVSIYGLVNKPDVIKINGNFREIAIGFNPYYLQLLFKSSMSDIAGGTNKNAYDFFNKDDINFLYDNIKAAKNDTQILTSISNFLLKQIDFSKEDVRLKSAINLIYNSQVNSITELSNSVNLSTVSIRHLFKDGVGLTPKELFKIVRIYKALQFNPLTHYNLTQFCYHLGYFDQSHFIHEFKQFMGVSPNIYYKNKELTFDFYNYGRWKGNIFDII